VTQAASEGSSRNARSRRVFGLPMTLLSRQVGDGRRMSAVVVVLVELAQSQGRLGSPVTAALQLHRLLQAVGCQLRDQTP
jgi:hypothetical protein